MINTFMLASDYYLVDFVKQMSAMTNGKAYFANPGNLSQLVRPIDFLRRRTRKVGEFVRVFTPVNAKKPVPIPKYGF
jgi:hypothetical protein